MYALTNVLGLGVSISEGVIAGVREFGGERFLQHTAPVGPGSDGGALVDSEARLLGIVRYRPLDGQNVNFAAPAAWLREIGERAGQAEVTPAWRSTAGSLDRSQSWEELARHAEAWTKALPDSVEAWFWRGYAAQRLGDWSTSESSYREALARNPSAVIVGVGLSNALLQQGRAGDALEVARDLLAVRREDASVWLAIGEAEGELRHQDAAREAFEQAARLDPWSAIAQWRLVALAGAEGDTAGLVAAALRLTRITPTSAEPWVELAYAYLLQDRAERARSCAERALERAPEQADALVLRGAALAHLGRLREAIESLQAGLAGHPRREVWAWSSLGDVFVMLTQYPDAIAAYKRALELAPEDLALKGRLGVALKDGGETDAALALFEDFVRKRPDDPFGWRQVGYVQFTLFRNAEAIEALTRSLELDPTQAQPWHALIAAYHAEGRSDDVRRAYGHLAGLHRKRADQAYHDFILPYEGKP